MVKINFKNCLHFKFQKYHCFLFNTCFALTRSNRRINSKYNLCFPVIPQDQLNAHVGSPNKSSIPSLKVGDHVLLSTDEHNQRHWLDSFKRLSAPQYSKSSRQRRSATVKGKENEPEIPDCIKNEFIRRGSKSGIRDGYFTISLRKTLLRHAARNSIDLNT